MLMTTTTTGRGVKPGLRVGLIPHGKLAIFFDAGRGYGTKIAERTSIMKAPPEFDEASEAQGAEAMVEALGCRAPWLRWQLLNGALPEPAEGTQVHRRRRGRTSELKGQIRPLASRRPAPLHLWVDTAVLERLRPLQAAQLGARLGTHGGIPSRILGPVLKTWSKSWAEVPPDEPTWRVLFDCLPEVRSIHNLCDLLLMASFHGFLQAGPVAQEVALRYAAAPESPESAPYIRERKQRLYGMLRAGRQSLSEIVMNRTISVRIFRHRRYGAWSAVCVRPSDTPSWLWYTQEPTVRNAPGAVTLRLSRCAPGEDGVPPHVELREHRLAARTEEGPLISLLNAVVEFGFGVPSAPELTEVIHPVLHRLPLAGHA